MSIVATLPRAVEINQGNSMPSEIDTPRGIFLAKMMELPNEYCGNVATSAGDQSRQLHVF